MLSYHEADTSPLPTPLQELNDSVSSLVQILYKDIYELIWAFPSLTASSREGYEIPGEGYEILSIWG